jgi:YVTN family beta-propeller protein
MRVWRLLICAFLTIQWSSWTAAQQTRFKALAFYSQNTEPDHVQFALDAVKFLSACAAREHFTFDTTTKWDDLNDERLRSYQLIIWLNESPTKIEQRSAFERYIQRGGAWLGFHAAAYNDKDTNWPWFIDFLGGAVFYINSWPPLPARLTIDDRTHEVSAGLPGEFDSPANEWYSWKPSPRQNGDVRVLVSFDPSNYPIGFKDVLTSGDLPVVWTNTKYKMLYMNMGHGDKIFTSPTQNELIDNAVNWLGTGVKHRTEPKADGIRINPQGIAVNPQTGKFYAVGTSQDTVMVLDADGHFLERIRVGKEPASIAVNPDTNRIYVANSASGTVSVIDGVTDKALAAVQVGDLPYAIAANRRTNKVYVSRTFGNDTVIIDGKTNTPTSVQAGAGDAVGADSLDEDTYLINYESPQVTVFDGANNDISKIGAPNHLWAVAASPAKKKIYAASAGNRTVTVIDATSHATRTVNAGEVPCAIAVDSSTGKVFVANYGSNDVTVLDGMSDAVLGTVKVDPYPQAIAVDSGNHKIYVASTHAGTTTVLDGTNNSVLSKVKTGRAPCAIAVNSKSHIAVAVGLDGYLTVIDGTTLAVSSPSIPESRK